MYAVCLLKMKSYAHSTDDSDFELTTICRNVSEQYTASFLLNEAMSRWIQGQ